MIQKPDPTTPDPVAYLKSWIRWAKKRIKAIREPHPDKATTEQPN